MTSQAIPFEEYAGSSALGAELCWRFLLASRGARLSACIGSAPLPDFPAWAPICQLRYEIEPWNIEEYRTRTSNPRILDHGHGKVACFCFWGMVRHLNRGKGMCQWRMTSCTALE